MPELRVHNDILAVPCGHIALTFAPFAANKPPLPSPGSLGGSEAYDG
jgi:hypothetical protein